MSEHQKLAPHLPEDIQEEAKSLVKQAFQLFADHFQQLTRDLAEFNKTQREIRERIRHGARRTSGRIV